NAWDTSSQSLTRSTRMLKENSKIKSQDLLDNSLTIDLEDTNANVYFEGRI
ncbi:29194_t:CDS:1, partial [Gigaspora margarita]